MQTAMFKKKVSLYTDSPVPESPEHQMLLLAKNLNKDKYLISLICPSNKQMDPWCKEWTSAGFRIKRFKKSNNKDPRRYLQLKKILEDEKPDLLHVHLHGPLACRQVFGGADLKTTKIVSTEHDPYKLSRLSSSFKNKLLAKTDFTLTVSDAAGDLMIKLYPQIKNKIVTVHNGIDLEEFRKPLIHFVNQQKNHIRNRIFNADADDFVIISVAALHERKGLNYLIEAFAKVAEKKDKVKLAIVGEGPERKKLEKLIKNLKLDDKVTLAGSQKEIALLLGASDLFVLASIKEAFGLAILEAMDAGIPVIGANVGGIPEIIEDNKTGLLVEPKDVESLKEKILQLMENQPLRQKLTYVASHHVKKFDAHEMVKKTEKIYDHLLNQ